MAKNLWPALHGHYSLPRAQSRRLPLGWLSRVVGRLHVSVAVWRVRRPPASAGKPGGKSWWPLHCRLHLPGHQRSAACRGSHSQHAYAASDGHCRKSSGGEAQRIRLATQIGSRLRGVLYVLDEPSIGLHARDNGRLLSSLEQLRDLGNTVIVVEHDEETIRRANHVVDLGPGAGKAGGYLVATGNPGKIARNAESLTGRYLSGLAKIPVPEKRRSANGKSLAVLG